MSVIQSHWTISIITALSCLTFQNHFSEQVPYYFYEIPYLFKLFADRANRKDPSFLSSKLLQFFSVLIFRLTKPCIFQVYFHEFNLGQLKQNIVDVTILASFFYTIPLKYWQSMQNHRISGNIIQILDAFGAAEIMIYLVQGTLKSASFFQYILIVVISNTVESLISWVMYRIEGSDVSLYQFWPSIKQTVFLEMKSCLVNIILFIVLHSQTKMSKIIYKAFYSYCSNSSNTILLEQCAKFLYAEDAIKSFNFSTPSTSNSTSKDIISTQPILEKQGLNVKQTQYCYIYEKNNFDPYNKGDAINSKLIPLKLLQNMTKR